MARMPALALVAALSFVLIGCVPQEKYNALKLDRDKLTEQLANAEKAASTARAEADLYRQSLDAIRNSGDARDAMVANLTASEAELRRQLDEYKRLYQESLGMVGKSGTALPEQLSSALSDFAAQNSDLVEFDPNTGIVKFKSDVTFALGSADLTPQAKTAIARFSDILNSGAAASYELLVAGHTDNTRVSNPATIAAGHKDNWYLSAHRAIAVGQELRGHNVNGQRMGVVGYADQRPVASNQSDDGRSRNRRVEVVILPRSVRSGGGSGVASSPAPAPSNSAVAPALNKDTGPSMNK